MQFCTEMIPALLLTAAVYLAVAAGLWKYEMKKVYGRRSRREKVLSVGVLVLFVLLELLIAARTAAPAAQDGTLEAQVYALLLWIFNGSVPLLAYAVYLVCGIPAAVTGAAILDEIAQQKTKIELPFYFYLLFFLAEGMFYRSLETSVTAWFALLLINGIVYGLIKNGREGTTRTKNLLLSVMAVLFLVLLAAQRGTLLISLAAYVVLFLVNVLAAFLLNRSGVLKKKIWCVVILICYILLFLIGRIL